MRNPMSTKHILRRVLLRLWRPLNGNKSQSGGTFGGALVLTGSGWRPMGYVEDLLKVHDIPVIVSDCSTFDTMDRIRR